MVDAVLIYSSDKIAAADRLRTAITQAGYSVGTDSEQAPNPSTSESVAEKLGAAGALIVIWSRAALADEFVSSAANNADARANS
jgi:hypothetical protein